jgi:hypothetical protein
MIDATEHCFVVPAHGASQHLDECLRALARQTIATRTLIATSTPNEHIHAVARRHGIPVHLNPEPGGGIGADWNFAIGQATTPWVTLAHQDDIYLPNFAERILWALSRHRDASLVFTQYDELERARIRPASSLIRIKKLLLELGFLGGSRASTVFFKTNTLRFGCAIPCPAVTLKANGLRFRTDLKVDLDWAAWLQMARAPGAFIYIRERLMQHRVHPDSETSSAISAGVRFAEDEAMLHSLWPAIIARAILASYRTAYRSNEVSTRL